MVKRKSDLRYRRTEEAITKAFNKLLKTSDTKKITVSALAREADIDRKTFYLHYESIDDLAVYRAKMIADEVLEEFKKAWDGKPETILTAFLEAMCMNIESNFALLNKLSASPRPVGSIEYFVSPMVKGIRESEEFNYDGSDEDLAAIIRFYVSGVFGVALGQMKSEGRVDLSVDKVRQIARPTTFKSSK